MNQDFKDFNMMVTSRFQPSTIAATTSPIDSTATDYLQLGADAKILLGMFYAIVIVVAVCGNLLVIYVVISNRNMQSPTNLFITNLAISDVVYVVTSAWITPLYTLYIRSWVFGRPMCYIFPLFQAGTVFISTFTLSAIALDRYIAILHPMRPRPSNRFCIITILFIWLVSFALVAPYAAHMKYENDETFTIYCYEQWPTPSMRETFGIVVLVLQYGIPLCLITITYSLIARRLWRVSTNGVRSAQREAFDLARKRRLIRMLILMVAVFTLCWAPVNIVNIARDSLAPSGNWIGTWINIPLMFLCAHVLAVSATCWNPMIYAFLNENFKREFRAVLPCFDDYARIHSRTGSFRSANPDKSGAMGELSNLKASKPKRKWKCAKKIPEITVKNVNGIERSLNLHELVDAVSGSNYSLRNEEQSDRR